MKRFAFLAVLVATFSLTALSTSLSTSLKFASAEKANSLLRTEDSFTKSWSQFDIDSRMQKKNSTREELFNHIEKQIRSWTEEEIEKLELIAAELDEIIEEKTFQLNIPETIYLVKTTALEEGSASGYTRGSYIILKDEMLNSSNESLKGLLVHELFHVLSRNNPEFRERMYGLIGFELMNDVSYPKSLINRRITNPDAPQVDSYIKLKVKGEPKSCMMILYAKEDYTSGDFFKYLNIGFLCLKGDKVKTVEYEDGQPVIYTFPQVSGFFEQVGRNTQYIIHPEEILADNFHYALLGKADLANPELVEAVAKQLRH